MPRIYPDESGRMLFGPGDYGRNPRDGRWYARAPARRVHWVGCLRKHVVTEHEDGTITVKPSILTSCGTGNGDKVRWHGYLERGVWREC